MKTGNNNSIGFKIISLTLTCLCIALISLSIFTAYKIRDETMLLEKKLDVLDGKLEKLSSDTESGFSQQTDFLNRSFANESALYGRMNSQIGGKINSLNETYTGLLQEQQKQHISTAEKDAEITDEQKTAEKLFAQGRYGEAAEKFNSVLVYQKNNQTVRFYAVYSEFLANPMDSTQYGRIVREFNELKQAGYQRKEIDTTLEYIKNETGE
ncbi:MAG TPA: hypothetical protein DCL73_01940 [Treponema sp.]|nr:hypothetical protein [Treponema sp.]